MKARLPMLTLQSGNLPNAFPHWPYSGLVTRTPSPGILYQ